MAKKENHLFEVIKAINEKNAIEYDPKKANKYILMLWLSQSRELIDIISKLNYNFFNVPDKLVFKYLYGKVPKKQRFIKYTKKEKLPKEEEKEIQELVDKYGISYLEAEKSVKGRKT